MGYFYDNLLLINFKTEKYKMESTDKNQEIFSKIGELV